jgi:hypothetical protein
MTQQSFLDNLYSQKMWHEDQLKQINIAIAAITQNDAETTKRKNYNVQIGPVIRKRTRSVLWTQEIKNILPKMGDDVFGVDGVAEHLVLNGVEEAAETKNKSSISTTLLRMADNGIIDKIEPGRYKNKQEIIGNTLLTENKNR